MKSVSRLEHKMSETVSVREATIKKSIITVSHLSKRYGSIAAVDDVIFSINEGEIFGIIGPNGAGKTTMVECISGLRVPDSGSVSIYDLSPKNDRDKLRKFIGVQIQESSLPPRIKVLEAVNLFASFYSSPLDSQELLETLGLTKKRNATFKKLSGGQKQRIALARTLLKDPDILILDDTTSSLDIETEFKIQKALEKLNRKRTTLMITHRISSVMSADQIFVMDRGRIVEKGTHPQLIALKGLYYDVYINQMGDFNSIAPSGGEVS